MRTMEMIKGIIEATKLPRSYLLRIHLVISLLRARGLGTKRACLKGRRVILGQYAVTQREL